MTIASSVSYLLSRWPAAHKVARSAWRALLRIRNALSKWWYRSTSRLHYYRVLLASLLIRGLITVASSVSNLLRGWPTVHRVVQSASRTLLLAWNVLPTLWGHRALLPRYWRVLLPSWLARDKDLRTRNDVVMLAISNLHVDPRVERAARALAAAGFHVRVIYPDAYPPYAYDQPIDWGERVTLLPLSRKAGEFVSQPAWLLGEEMHEAARLERPFAFHCHDLTTSVIGLSAARATGALCVADFHEWYSENVSWDFDRSTWGPHPSLKQQFFRATEKLLLWRADAVITVCDSIAEELETMAPFGRRKVEVIRNIPPLIPSKSRYRSLKETLGLSFDQFLLLWQGGTGPSRLLEPVIESLALATNITFAIRGPSLEHYGDGYRALAEKVGVDDRLVLLPPVPSADVVDAAVGADAGIWTLPNLSKNFYYALPNKIFEYMAAGLPVLAANFPEARKMVEGYGVGLCFDPYDPRSIAAQVRRLAEEPGLAARCRAAIPVTLREIRAEYEWDKLVRLYERLRRERAGGPAHLA